MVWTPEAGQLVERLIAELMATRLSEETRAEVTRLGALPIGYDLWAAYYLRPTGEVVVVGADLDRPDVDVVSTDRLRVLGTLVWGSRRYPELRGLLPERGPGATDCPCLGYPEFFGPGKVICPECEGLGWRPAPGPAAGPAEGDP